MSKIDEKERKRGTFGLTKVNVHTGTNVLGLTLWFQCGSHMVKPKPSIVATSRKGDPLEQIAKWEKPDVYSNPKSSKAKEAQLEIEDNKD